MFTPENDLERALVAAIERPDARIPFLKAMLEAELALALVDDGQTKGGGYVVPEVTHEDLAFVPIFTADSRVKAMFGSEKLMVVRQSFRQILSQIDGANFVLNPGSDVGHEFMAEDVAAMVDGDFERANAGFEDDGEDEEEPELPSLVGRPSPMPTHLTNALSDLFKSRPDVASAQIAQAVFADPDGSKRLVIGISTSGDLDDLLDQVGDVLERVAKPSDVIDFVPVPGSPLDGYFERDTQPFYRRA
jgi:hypothetical protein